MYVNSVYDIIYLPAFIFITVHLEYNIFLKFIVIRRSLKFPLELYFSQQTQLKVTVYIFKGLF